MGGGGWAGLATSALGAALEVQGEELEEDTTEIEEKDDATYVAPPLFIYLNVGGGLVSY